MNSVLFIYLYLYNFFEFVLQGQPDALRWRVQALRLQRARGNLRPHDLGV